MIDAVLDWHMAPHTCGVSKFNAKLAQELGVPMRPLMGMGRLRGYPLVSVKTEEIDGHEGSPQNQRWHEFCPFGKYELFLHDVPDSGREFLQNPTRVYAANKAIADALRSFRPDVIEAWCPSTIHGNPERGAINVLTFGMAGKLDAQMGRYEKLRTLLDGTGEDYTVSVSTAIHEGSPWDDTAAVGDRLRGVFDDHLRVLGYLADDALARELRDCSAVALFYDPALRANNTTYWAAADARKPVITNVDADSPRDTYYDIAEMTEWPKRLHSTLSVSAAEQWQRLVEQFQEQPCASSS
jgi:hypothetical protein